MEARAVHIRFFAGHGEGPSYHPATFMHRAVYIFGLVVLSLVAGCKHYQARDISAAHKLEQLESRTLQDPGLEAFLQTNSPATLERTRSGEWDLDSFTWA